MSIWSSFAGVEPLYEGGYGAHIVEGSWLDLADTGCRGERGDLLRICIGTQRPPVESGIDEGRCVLDRQQAIALRDHLTAWLERCPGSVQEADGGH